MNSSSTPDPDRQSISPGEPGPEPAVPPTSQAALTIPQTTPLVVYVLMGITIAIFLLQVLSETLIGQDLPAALGAKINSAIFAGQYWRLLTPVLLHASILHIGFNMYALFVIGPGLERQYGHLRFLALYLISGFAGNVLSLILSPAASLGASTAIFGLLAAEGIFVFQNKRLFGERTRSILTNIVVIAVVNLVIGLSPGIDNWGHLGGLIGGILFAWFAGPIWELDGYPPYAKIIDRRSSLQIELTTLVVTALFAAIAIFYISAH